MNLAWLLFSFVLRIPTPQTSSDNTTLILLLLIICYTSNRVLTDSILVCNLMTVEIICMYKYTYSCGRI